jgi:hypothetical protein
MDEFGYIIGRSEVAKFKKKARNNPSTLKNYKRNCIVKFKTAVRWGVDLNLFF